MKNSGIFKAFLLLIFAALFLSACAPRIFGITRLLSRSHPDASSYQAQLNASYFQFSAATTSHSMLIDLNQDGKKEIVSYDWQNRMIIIDYTEDNGIISSRSTLSSGTSSESYNINFADMNGDLIPDLVYTGRLPGRINVVNVSLGLGDGTFAAQSSYDGCNRNYRVSIADLNNDGFNDIVCGFSGEVFLNNGDGTLAAPSAYPDAGSSMQYLFGPQLIDLNGDGWIDIVGAAGVLINDQTGTNFSALATYGGAGFSFVADLDGDGFPDGAKINAFQNVDIYRNQGDGTFVFDSQINVGGTDIDYVTSAELNGDGNLDLVIADRILDKVSIYLGDGMGGFSAHDDFGYKPGYSLASSLLVEDFDHDGDHDILYLDQDVQGRAYIVLNDGQGSFSKVLNEQTVSIGAVANGVLSSDLNGDGFPDLFSLLSDNTYQVNLNQGDGTFGAAVSSGAAGYSYHAGLYDFNADGVLDVLSCSDQISIFLGNGDGTFAVPTDYVLASGMGLSCIASDLDLDGNLDVVFTDLYAPSLLYRMGNGDGTLGAEVQIASPNESVNVRAVDMNGDSYPDLVEMSVLNGVSFDVLLHVNMQNGTFAPAIVIASGVVSASSGYGALEVSDVDQDGSPDVIVLANQILVYRNLGNGTLGVATTYAGEFGYLLKIEDQISVADVNQDGFPDLIYLTSAGRSEVVSYRINQGNGSFGSLSIFVTSEVGGGGLISISATQDLDGDGFLEVISNGMSSYLSIFGF